MFYYTDIELKALESLKEKDLNAEQLAIVDKLAKGMKETIYKASYETEDVVNEVFELFENGRDEEIYDACEAETKILNNKNFFNEVHEDLTDLENYPTWDDFNDIVDRLAEKHFEVVDGKLYVKGLADM